MARGTMEPTAPVNPYSAPSAELDVARSRTQSANLENALEGRYDFRIGEVMDEAWALVNGMKASFWGAAVVIGIIYLIVDTGCAIIFGMFMGELPPLMVNVVYKSVVSVVMTPLMMGLYMMCVRRALDAPISFSTAFSYLSRSGTAILGTLLVTLLRSLGFALLLIPGIYLAVGYQLTTQLICDQELSAWRSMETSRRAIHHHWWRVLGLNLVAFFLLLISGIPLGIPLIWTIPWYFMVSAVLYRKIFFAAGPAPDMPAPNVSPAGPPRA
jgi:hypothetical protein